MNLEYVNIPPAAGDWIRDHVALYLKDPEKGHLWDSSIGGGTGMVHTLLLQTKGRKSGTLFTMPLIYRKFDKGYVVIASKGGAPDHPFWYKNLVAEPKCRIQVKDQVFDVVARTVEEGAERDTYWNKLVEDYSPFKDYQERANPRLIPVVLLEPAK